MALVDEECILLVTLIHEIPSESYRAVKDIVIVAYDRVTELTYIKGKLIGAETVLFGNARYYFTGIHGVFRKELGQRRVPPCLIRCLLAEKLCISHSGAKITAVLTAFFRTASLFGVDHDTS